MTPGSAGSNPARAVFYFPRVEFAHFVRFMSKKHILADKKKKATVIEKCVDWDKAGIMLGILPTLGVSSMVRATAL